MTNVTLNYRDRLVLANQLRILERLDPDEESTYRRARTIIEHGFEAEYGNLHLNIYSPPVPLDVCEEVHAVLEMYRVLIASYEKLAEKDGVDRREVTFPGFDGNNEAEHLDYAEFLASQKKYEESKIIDSHLRKLPLYRRMLAEYEEVTADTNKSCLTAADIKRIIEVT